MKEDGLTALAMMFKSRDNQSLSSIGIGTVVSAPPEIIVSFGNISDLDKDDLVFSSELEKSLKPGDEIIVIPTTDDQTYFVLAKAVRL